MGPRLVPSISVVIPKIEPRSPAVQASQATIDLLTEYYGAMESNDPRRYGTYYADDMSLTFGNDPTITGRENVVAAFTEVLKRVWSPAPRCGRSVGTERRRGDLRVGGRVGPLRRHGDLDQRLHGADAGRREVRRPADLR
jgi:hypothetical protein